MPDQIPQLIDPMVASAKAWIGTTEGVLAILGSMFAIGATIVAVTIYVSGNTAIAEAAQKTASRAEIVNERQDQDLKNIDRRLATLEVEVRNNTKAINNLSSAIGNQTNVLIDRFEDLLERKGVIE